MRNLMETENMNTSTKRIPAPIDGKNIGFDWIETAFDYCNCTCGGYKDRCYVGFVNNCAVLATINSNYIDWDIMSGMYVEDLRNETYDILMERLMKFDAPDDRSVQTICEYDTRYKKHGNLRQTFYFKEEEDYD